MNSRLLKAAKLAVESYQAMRSGAEVRTESTIKIPFVHGGYFYCTPEGCSLCSCTRGTRLAVLEAFNILPEKVRHRLCFSPENGEFCERARLWRDLLKPVLPSRQYHEAMSNIFDLYREIKISRREKVANDSCNRRLVY